MLFRHQVGGHAILLKFLRSARPNCSDAATSDRTSVVTNQVKGAEEIFHRVWTRENNPIVGVAFGHTMSKLTGIITFGLADTNCRHLEHIGSHSAKVVLQLAGLLAGPSHHDALAEQRPLLKPVELLAAIHHSANDTNGRRFEFRIPHDVGNRRYRSGHGLMLPCRRLTDERNRGLRITPFFDDRLHDVGQPRHPHQHDLSAGRPDNLAIVDRRIFLIR